MADQKISARTAASSLTGAEIVGVIQSGTDKKTTAQEIADLGTGEVITAKISISSAEILALFSTPKTLIAAPGAGKIIQPLMFLHVYTYGTVTYATNTNADIYYNGSLTLVGTTILNRTASTIQRQGAASTTAASFLTASQVIVDRDLMLNVQTGDPTAGDGTLVIYVSYLIITL